MNKLREKKIISFLFNTVIFLTLLFPTEGILAQTIDSNDKAVFFVEDNALENGQEHPVEAEPSPPILPQPKESPIIRETSEDKSSKEGIGDAFSQDHRDRFQPKVESRPLAEDARVEGRSPPEKTNKIELGKEKPDC